MKTVILSFLIALLTGFHGRAAQAWIMENGVPQQKVTLISATGNSIRYQPIPPASGPVDLALNASVSVQVCEPPEFAEAMDLYQGRRYGEAMAKFIRIKNAHGPIELLDSSYSTPAAFYELECLRRTGDLEGLAAALQKLPKGAITREHQQRQLELYILWDAVRSESWERLESLALERYHVRLPADQRAQVAYCHGRALEGLGRSDEALLPYNTAMTAGAGASEVIARQAALRILGIYLNDDDVKAALKAVNSKSSDNSAARWKLAAAVSVTRLFEMLLGGGTPLPEHFKEFRR